MRINISRKDRDMIITMLENGAGNGRISLKFPGITRRQIENIRAEMLRTPKHARYSSAMSSHASL